MLEGQHLQSLEKRFFRDSSFLNEVLVNYQVNQAGCFKMMRLGLELNDKNMLSQAAHKLRGSTLNFIENSLTEKLGQIESSAETTPAEIDNLESNIKNLIADLHGVTEKWTSEKRAALN
jgi:HPt (histidine-containing phosphotransfer) domain-containing protein